MKTIKDLENKEKGRPFLIVGAGSSTKIYLKGIRDYITKTIPTVIGINNITEYFIPHYHLWTNTQRFRTYGKYIVPCSNLLLGSNIPLKVINNVIGDVIEINGVTKNREYTLINYTDKEGIPIDYKKGKIYGYYRTAGCLAIMIANIMGASEINIVGMDGYSKYEYKDLESGNESQHCYGKGFTDTATWETCIKKDKLINGVLKNIKNYGINFKIITPTKYGEFYDSSRLYIS